MYRRTIRYASDTNRFPLKVGSISCADRSKKAIKIYVPISYVSNGVVRLYFVVNLHDTSVLTSRYFGFGILTAIEHTKFANNAFEFCFPH
jgi:hypothetical protein